MTSCRKRCTTMQGRSSAAHQLLNLFGCSKERHQPAEEQGNLGLLKNWARQCKPNRQANNGNVERRGLCDNPRAPRNHRRMWQLLAACLTTRQGSFDYPDPSSRVLLFCRNFRRQASKWIEEKMLERCWNWCHDYWILRQEFHGP